MVSFTMLEQVNILVRLHHLLIYIVKHKSIKIMTFWHINSTISSTKWFWNVHHVFVYVMSRMVWTFNPFQTQLNKMFATKSLQIWASESIFIDFTFDQYLNLTQNMWHILALILESLMEMFFDSWPLTFMFYLWR